MDSYDTESYDLTRQMDDPEKAYDELVDRIFSFYDKQNLDQAAPNVRRASLLISKDAPEGDKKKVLENWILYETEEDQQDFADWVQAVVEKHNFNIQDVLLDVELRFKEIAEELTRDYYERLDEYRAMTRHLGEI